MQFDGMMCSFIWNIYIDRYGFSEWLGALVVTLAMLLRLINCRFIITIIIKRKRACNALKAKIECFVRIYVGALIA